MPWNESMESLHFPIEEIKKQMEDEKEFYFASYLEMIVQLEIIKMLW